jgi:hypothetical protein
LHTRPKKLVRTNITIATDLLREVDRLTGRRGRSRYVSEAVEQRVKRDRLARALERTRGAMVGTPGWRSPEEVIRWVNGLRDEERDPWADSSRG